MKVSDPLGGSTLFRKGATKKTSGLFPTLTKLDPFHCLVFLVPQKMEDQDDSGKYHSSCLVFCVPSNKDPGTRAIWVVSVPMNQTPTTEPLFIAGRAIGSWEATIP